LGDGADIHAAHGAARAAATTARRLPIWFTRHSVEIREGRKIFLKRRIFLLLR
jgi:hypothetical protein